MAAILSRGRWVDGLPQYWSFSNTKYGCRNTTFVESTYIWVDWNIHDTNRADLRVHLKSTIYIYIYLFNVRLLSWIATLYLVPQLRYHQFILNFQVLTFIWKTSFWCFFLLTITTCAWKRAWHIYAISVIKFKPKTAMISQLSNASWHQCCGHFSRQ